jgi:hypothetical protein
MELIHNGSARPIDAACHATVGDVLAACTSASEHVLVELKLNGTEIDESERSAVAQLSTRGSGRLEVVSRPRREAALAGLESASAYAAQVAGAFARTAGLLRDGRLERAHALFRNCVDALSVLVVAVQRAALALGAEAEPLHALERELAGPLETSEGRLAEADWVGLADCLEYEIAAHVGRWAPRIDAVRIAAEERS